MNQGFWHGIVRFLDRARVQPRAGGPCLSRVAGRAPVGARPLAQATAFALALVLTWACADRFTSVRAAEPAKAAAPVRILAFGDSLTAGYELDQAEAFPVQLEAALRARGRAVSVRNGGVSGDTTRGGLARLDWTLDGPFDLVIVELGANDALRGLDPSETERNLDAILAKLAARKTKVLLAGMLAPPNMGADYARAFNDVFPRLAARHKVPLYPFFLDGVAAQAGLRLADGMHPNGRGVAVIVERIAPFVIRALDDR